MRNQKKARPRRALRRGVYRTRANFVRAGQFVKTSRKKIHFCGAKDMLRKRVARLCGPEDANYVTPSRSPSASNPESR